MNSLNIAKAVFYRTWMKLIRRPVTLGFSFIQPMMWLFFFGFLFQRFELNYPGIRYLDFLLPGICCMTILFGASQAGVTLIRDMQTGFFSRMHSTPASDGIILAGKIAADSFRLLIQALVVCLLGLLVGAKLNIHVGGLLLALLLLALFSVAYTALSCLIAVKTRTPETMATFIHVFNMPILFTSTALVPAKQMPDWLAGMAMINPLSMVVDQLRSSLALGRSEPSLLAFALLTGLAIVLFFLCIQAIKKAELN